MKLMRISGWWLTIVLVATAASGCATLPGTGQLVHDPWENLNRTVFQFNERVDKALLIPVSTTYVRVLPEPVRNGVANILGNIGDVWSGSNHLLQGKVKDGLKMGARVIVNTTVGLVGLLDPATDMHLPRKSEDFGQTLGSWGVGAGPYLVLPLLGPSTLRDGPALLVDRLAAPSAFAASRSAANAITALEAVNLRASLLSTIEFVDEIALDKYSFVRETFLARRLSNVHDSNPPVSQNEDDRGEMQTSHSTTNN